MAEGTMYVVLRQRPIEPGENTDDYEYRGNYSAANAKAAIQKAVAETNTDGVYVAVPVRSFQLVTVDIESTTRVKLS